jgi:hypothetical protein
MTRARSTITSTAARGWGRERLSARPQTSSTSAQAGCGSTTPSPRPTTCRSERLRWLVHPPQRRSRRDIGWMTLPATAWIRATFTEPVGDDAAGIIRCVIGHGLDDEGASHRARERRHDDQRSGRHGKVRGRRQFHSRQVARVSFRSNPDPFDNSNLSLERQVWSMAVPKRGEASSRVTTLLDRVGQGGASKRVRPECHRNAGFADLKQAAAGELD